MAEIDSNTWYWVTETRINWNSSFQVVSGDAVAMVAPDNTSTTEYWQFFAVPNGYYQVRNKNTGVGKQLSTCFNSNEEDPAHTQPCMQTASGDKSQLWQIEAWGDGTWRFVNVGNGSNYNMDCHPGDPMFMSSVTAAVPNQPAQHWEFSSLAEINDGAYSTTITYIPPSGSPASATASTSAGSTSSSTASAAGSSTQATGGPSDIGAGASNGPSHNAGFFVEIILFPVLGILLIVAAAIIFILYRRGKLRMRGERLHELVGSGIYDDHKPLPAMPHEMFVPPAELSANHNAYELGRTPIENQEHKPENLPLYGGP